jgi:hypothetical protein
MTDTPKSTYRCPKCKETDGFLEAVLVQGFRSLDKNLEPTDGEKDVDWDHVARDSGAFCEVGCGECGWDGARSELVKLELDGEPLPYVHPGQITLA